MTCDVLVTGGAGFIGSHVVRDLVAVGRRVRVLELPGTPIDHLPLGHVDLAWGDVRHAGDARRAVAGCAVVLHLAGNPNLWTRDADEFDRTNHRGTRHVIDAAIAAGARRIVHVSTESILATRDRDQMITEQTWPAYQDAVGPYCRSKWLAERYARQAAERGGPVIVASPTVPIGSGAGHSVPITRLIADFAAGRIRATLSADINLIDVRDAAEGIVAAAERGRRGARYLLAGENWDMVRLFRLLAELSGRPEPTFNVPYPVALAYAWAEEQWCAVSGNGRLPMATLSGVRLTRRSMKFDATATRRELGLTRRPVEPAIREAYASLAAGRRPPGSRAMISHLP
jgi:dihydroflavonol-4-reductase